MLAKKKLRWIGLDQSYNYRCGMRGLHSVVLEELKAAKILHYHRAMNPEHWQTFLQFLSDDYGDVSQLLGEKYLPVGATTPVVYKAMNRLWRQWRGGKAKAYRSSCANLSITAKEGEG